MKLFKSLKNQKGLALSMSKGFTLIELLVVIGILAVLLAITLIAINPGRQFSQANNTQRSSDVNSILNAIGQYMADNKGSLPTGLASGDASKPISSAVGGTLAAFCTGLVPDYIAALPVDPKSGTVFTNCTTYNTAYTVSVSATNGRVTVTAPDTEIPPATIDVSVTR